jgi:beta-aspartyl-peptidase (threonine type)
MKATIMVHGGAGIWDLPAERLLAAIAACRDAAAAGQAILLAGGTALDAVEAAVCVLEDSPVLDAGRGSYLNANGEIELDALVMDGSTLAMGAVAAVQRVRHPITLARRVMDDTEHNFLVGAGAEAFADRIGFPRCTVIDLLADDEREKHLAQPGHHEALVKAALGQPGPPGDTVGAVALDVNGNLAAATSTGGTRNKLPGRVGDSPLVGSGAYADNWTAAVSATGHGEALMKVVISKLVCDFVANGLSAQGACEAAIRVLAERVNGMGGLIAIDTHGRIGFAFNTAAMPYAYVIGDATVVSGC